jgi:hypothetical protein
VGEGRVRVTVTREIDLSELPVDAPWRAAFEDIAASHVYTYPDDDGRYVEVAITVEVDPPERQTRDYPGCDASVSGIHSAILHAPGQKPKRLPGKIAEALCDWLGEALDEKALDVYDEITGDPCADE